jgi:RNA polymerase sigma-70 factor (ECF subfamily)
MDEHSELTVEAVGAMYRWRYTTFLRVAEAVTGDVELARDAVNEGFANALQSRASYRGEGSAEAWVWSCIVNAARRTRRRQGPSVNGSSEDVAIAPPQTPEADTAIAAALAQLPERQRLVLFLRYYADLDYGSIAAVLTIDVGTVGAHLHKAHRSLRRCLEESPHEHV